MVRGFAALAVLLVALSPAPVHGADEAAPLEFVYPLVPRRPVIERELELRFAHDKTREGRRSEAAVALELPILPRWQVELEIPGVFTDPREGASAGGVGDIELQNKFLLLKSVEHKALVAVGFDFEFPSGSARRGLGGEAAGAPFLAAGSALRGGRVGEFGAARLSRSSSRGRRPCRGGAGSPGPLRRTRRAPAPPRRTGRSASTGS